MSKKNKKTTKLYDVVHLSKSEQRKKNQETPYLLVHLYHCDHCGCGLRLNLYQDNTFGLGFMGKESTGLLLTDEERFAIANDMSRFINRTATVPFVYKCYNCGKGRLE